MAPPNLYYEQADCFDMANHIPNPVKKFVYDKPKDVKPYTDAIGPNLYLANHGAKDGAVTSRKTRDHTSAVY